MELSWAIDSPIENSSERFKDISSSLTDSIISSLIVSTLDSILDIILSFLYRGMTKDWLDSSRGMSLFKEFKGLIFYIIKLGLMKLS
jgi:hypothetical protein